jgi:type II secretory ATPase GspE/PulE/Tfp pilus assembly ATPase PilB-like protein
MPVTDLDSTCLYGSGLRREDVETVAHAIRLGRGVIFVCGPPGSGRRAAMYSLLSAVDRETHSVATVERSIQRHLMGVSQTELSAGQPIGALLRAFPRSYADVVMIDPIEGVTDAISLVRASGGTVIIAEAIAESSLEPLCELLEMGAPPRLICRMVTCVVSTRTVPKLCPRCRRPAEMPLELLTAFPPIQEAAVEFKAYESPGCSLCDHSGRLGSLALYEVREVGPQLEGILGGDYTPKSLSGAGLRTTVMGILADALHKSAAGLLDLRDLEPLVRQCPPTAQFEKFWEG